MSDSIPITPKGKEIVGKKISDLEVRLPAIRTAIAEAREKGDLSENAEYHAARESLAMVEAQIGDLYGKLSLAQIVDPKRAPRDKVAFGCSVTVLDIETKKKETYHLVGLGEDDPEAFRILTTSPMGQGLLLKKVGDEVEFALPRGTVHYRGLDISYP